MRNLSVVLAATAWLALAGCGSSTKTAASAEPAEPAASKAKIYSMDDVNQELSAAGVALGATQEIVRSFFKDHPAYHVCRDDDTGGLIAVMKNSKVDPKSDDQYIVIAYREGKVANLDIGPPQFSAGNVASYCQ